MTIYVAGKPLPPCPRCGAEINRWRREELLDAAYRPAVVRTLECADPACEWCAQLEDHLIALRPPRPKEPA